jgi:hypothetical protein
MKQTTGETPENEKTNTITPLVIQRFREKFCITDKVDGEIIISEKNSNWCLSEERTKELEQFILQEQELLQKELAEKIEKELDAGWTGEQLKEQVLSLLK